ncbi:Uncharacterized protein TCM_022961 [Theobroma cacao]|uniref:Uncharacterized protein n=1 Tax=Theobroma cacao TaxID=3641 RepID=A0A061ETU2_THECC|nr:Uncharacterized protein TCM_022961 [Theobroma cacao]
MGFTPYFSNLNGVLWDKVRCNMCKMFLKVEKLTYLFTSSHLQSPNEVGHPISPSSCASHHIVHIARHPIYLPHHRHHRKKQGRVGRKMKKIDLEKVYDRLKWEFIHDTLLEVRIPTKIIDVLLRS